MPLRRWNRRRHVRKLVFLGQNAVAGNEQITFRHFLNSYQLREDEIVRLIMNLGHVNQQITVNLK